MFTHRSSVAVITALVGAVFMGASPHAGTSWGRTNHITFNVPLGLPGVTLAPGTYIFELADPLMSTDIVRVFNRDRSIVYLTAFTARAERPPDWPANRPISIGEARPGMVPPILAWYPDGEPLGYRFLYRVTSR
jgi:hypothetical protein